MMKNIFDQIPAVIPEELFDLIHKNSNIKIERIISKGHTSPKEGWFDQDLNEWVILLEGEANIEFEDNPKETIVTLVKGSYLFIPKNKKHKVIYTSTEPSCVWLAIFFS
jgi:cupin 2 domain-containing protein